MKIRALSYFIAIAILAAAPSLVSAQPGLKVGRLRCNVAGGFSFIVASRDIACTFTSLGGRHELYYGSIDQFGADIGETDQAVLEWAVFAPTRNQPRGALAGEYEGVDASATVGVGVGANLLVGGSNNTISLQPLSVQAQTGISLASGAESLTLRPGG